MKKFISLLMVVLMIMSVATVAFAAPGSYKEEAANSYVFLKCEKCSSCTGKFGCECCEACPGYMGEDGVPDNLGEYLDCRFGFYYDIDVYKYNPDGSIKTKSDGTYDLEHEGTFKMRYYWKTPCCGECTGKKAVSATTQTLKIPAAAFAAHTHPTTRRNRFRKVLRPADRVSQAVFRQLS